MQIAKSTILSSTVRFKKDVVSLQMDYGETKIFSSKVYHELGLNESSRLKQTMKKCESH